MKTILYCENNTDGTIGGSYYSLLYLVSGLDRSRYRPIVIFHRDNALVPEFLNAGIETHVMPRPAAVEAAPAVLRKPVNFFKLLLFPVFSYIRCLRRHGVDLVHLNNSVLRNHGWMLAAFLARIPCITHERGINPGYSASARLLSRRLAAIVCISEAVKQSLLDGGIKHADLRTIPNGLDPSRMALEEDRESVRARHGIGLDDPVIGIVGNLKQWKGQQVVLRAMSLLVKEVPGVRCLVVGAVASGEGSFERRLRDMRSDLGLTDRVIFAGYRRNVADYVNAMDVLVHASVLPEPFGRVLLEGMALRKPLVASWAGGVPEIITDGESGVLYAPGDHAQLAVEIVRLLNNPDQAAAIGEAGHNRLVEQFGIDKHVSRIERLYEAILQ